MRAVELPPGVSPGGRFGDWRPVAVGYAVCDVDGTLVGPFDHASDEVVAAVGRVQAAGIRVGLATGRMRTAVSGLVAQLGALGPHVLHNGAEVRDDGETLACWSLTIPQVAGLLDVARRLDAGYLEVYTEEGYWVSRRDERARAHWAILGAEPDGVLEDAGQLAQAVLPKATFALFDPALAAPVVDAIAGLGLLPGPAGSPRTPDITYVNATHPDAGKGAALTRAAAHLGIGLGQVVAIGDAANDLPMLAVAGTAIAMGQAPAEVRAAAHLVVPDVDSHGVAVALDAVAAMGAPQR